MWAVVIIAKQELLYQAEAIKKVLKGIAVPAEALFAHSAVEAFDEGLLVPLVGPGYAMSLAVGRSPFGEGPFELAAAVRLDQFHPAVEAPRHSLFREGAAVSGSQGGSQQDVRLPGIFVDAREGEDPSKHHRVNLNHLARA